MKVQIKALKVKVKSLAAEAVIIRMEERRSLGRRSERVSVTRKSGVYERTRTVAGKRADEATYRSLRWHRVWDVRREQRSALLAYAFLRGRDYAACERPAEDNRPDLDRVMSLVKKFGPPGNIWTKGTLERMVGEWVAGTITDNPFAVKKLSKTA